MLQEKMLASVLTVLSLVLNLTYSSAATPLLEETPKSPQTETITGAQQWEYRVDYECRGNARGQYRDAKTFYSGMQGVLNNFGQSGWELVNFTPISLPGLNECFSAVFKRPSPKQK